MDEAEWYRLIRADMKEGKEMDVTQMVKPKTNGGRLRAMDNRELSGWIAGLVADYARCFCPDMEKLTETDIQSLTADIQEYLDASVDG